MKKLAIIGSGISGISCAHYLKKDYQISIFEKNDYLGGHTHTHIIEENGKKFTLDTGFIVFNLETYPNLIQLFKELGIEKQKSDMSFSVINQKNNFQYATKNFLQIFAQTKNLFSFKYWRFLREITLFFKEANKDYSSVQTSKATLKEYCEEKNLSLFFIDNFLVPMTSAVWSTPHEEIYNFPIASLLPFFHNHGLLGLDQQFQWYTVKGGSNSYTKKIIENNNFDIHFNEEVLSAEEFNQKVILKTKKESYEFDFVICSTHADESLKIVKNLPENKKNLLKAFCYNDNKAVLHTDESLMPSIKRAWASWNHNIAEEDGKYMTSTTYWLNKLQNPETKTNYFLSLNPFLKIQKDKIFKEITYQHPLFNPQNFAIQKNLQDLNQDTNLFFTGSYFGYGFHEDGLKSALEVIKKLK